MKLLNLKLLSILLILSAFTISCSKDDDDDVKTFDNYIRHDGVDYEMSHGMVELFGHWLTDESYNIDLTLFSPNMNDDLSLKDPEQKGHLFYLQMYTDLETSFEEGVYNYDAESSMAVFTFNYGVLLKHATETNTSGVQIEVTDGRVTIAKQESIYEITIECTGADDKPITGYYSGPLNTYDLREKKSSVTKESKSIR